MEKFKLATQQKLRFHTEKGPLTTEQLWDLSLTDLDTLAVFLEGKTKDTGKKSFLTGRTTEDDTAKLMFDVVFEVLTTKVEEMREASERIKNKQFNDKIISLIAEKEDDSLKGKTIEELKEMLK